MKNRIHLICFYVLFIVLNACTTPQENEWIARAPEGRLMIRLMLKDGQLLYAVTDDEQQLVGPSTLGIESNLIASDEALTFESVEQQEFRDEYKLTSGKRLDNETHANETSVLFTSENGESLRIDLRAYHDGVAFRYAFPEKGKTVEVTNELTEFSIGEGHAWMQAYLQPGQYDPAYETPFQNRIVTGTPAPEGSGGWSFPMLFETGVHWLLITESDAKPTYFASHIQPKCDSGRYRLALPFPQDALGQGTVTIADSTPVTTPWRIIMAGTDPGAIVESTLVTDLATPSQVKNTDWIKPGRSSWSWWSDHSSSKNFEKLKKYVDFASDMNWEYSLVDANWNIMEGGDIKQLIDYAKTKDVGLTLWYNSGGPHNNVTEQPRDKMYDPDIRKQEMKKLADWGIKAIKVDFFQSDKPFIMKEYLGILKDAAENHLMVDFHGCTMPRGWSRTYPNLMSMEGIRGAEQLGWSDEYAQQAPMLNTILPFTRNAVGPMDYTPVTFSSYACCEHRTSNAHELALSVLFESGIQHFADSDSSYRAQSEEVTRFLQEVPVAWDETKYISGMPGEDVVLARRKGSDWYIAGINGENRVKQLNLALPFAEGEYDGVLLKDGEDNRTITSEEIHLTAGETRQVEVLPNGGFTIHLKKTL